MAKKVLVVEDDSNIAELLRLYLEKDGFDVFLAADGGEGIRRAQELQPDLILLDIMLPVVDGWVVCSEVRKTSNVPIIMLTAKGETFDKISGLEMGADDYVTKPFAIEELLARIRVALKHGTPDGSAGGDEIRAGKLCVNTRNREVTFDGQEVTLTKTEFDMLAYMAAHPDKVLSRDELLSEVWGYSYAGDTNIVDVYVRYLRQKLDERFNVKLMHTVRGVGYLFRYEEQ